MYMGVKSLTIDPVCPYPTLPPNFSLLLPWSYCLHFLWSNSLHLSWQLNIQYSWISLLYAILLFLFPLKPTLTRLMPYYSMKYLLSKASGVFMLPNPVVNSHSSSFWSINNIWQSWFLNTPWKTFFSYVPEYQTLNFPPTMWVAPFQSLLTPPLLSDP